MYIAKLENEKADQLKFLSSKLLVLESKLIRKQKEISSMLGHREMIIQKQQKLIGSLTDRLIDNGLDPATPEIFDLETNLLDLESLNDSDSAVVLEDMDTDLTFTFPRSKSGYADPSLVRSVSDAIHPSLKYSSRRTNGLLRRPEILETVFSVEEDADSEQQTDQNSQIKEKRNVFAMSSEKAISNNTNEDFENQNVNYPHVDTLFKNSSGHESDDGKYSYHKPATQLTTYNRVMLNHRSVTKPKDVKYKRINKAKSKSLEELRCKLKSWVDQGGKGSNLKLEHTQSCV